MGYKLEDISLDIIRDFIENGSVENADPAVVMYLETIEKIRSMKLRFDQFPSKDHIVKHLIKVNGHSAYLANRLYSDTIEYFYCDSKISKDAWRNLYAEEAEKDIALARLLAKDVSDLAKISRMRKDLAEMRQLDKEDVEELPEEMFLKPWKLYDMDAAFLGMPDVNRHELAKQIDSYPDLTEKERELIKREAAILPVKLFLDESENARKS